MDDWLRPVRAHPEAVSGPIPLQMAEDGRGVSSVEGNLRESGGTGVGAEQSGGWGSGPVGAGKASPGAGLVAGRRERAQGEMCRHPLPYPGPR